MQENSEGLTPKKAVLLIVVAMGVPLLAIITVLEIYEFMFISDKRWQPEYIEYRLVENCNLDRTDCIFRCVDANDPSTYYDLEQCG